MALNVSALAAYTDETSGELVKKMILKGNTPSIISVMPGIKSSKNINTIGSTIYMTLGSCGFTNSGTTALGKVNLAVTDIKINESICLDTLEDYYTQVMMRPGSYNENIPFEQIYAEEKSELISKEIDKILWQGNTTSGSGNLSLVNGFLAYLDAIPTQTITGATAAFSAASVISAVDALVAKVPADIVNVSDLTLFVSPSEYQVYLTGLRNGNYYHYSADFNFNAGVKHPSSNVTIRPIVGLQGSTRHILTPASNLYMGVDLLTDAEQFSIFYSKDNDEVRFISKFKLGCAVAFPSYVVVQ